MAARVSCPSCETIFEGPLSSDGVQCPKCSQVLHIATDSPTQSTAALLPVDERHAEARPASGVSTVTAIKAQDRRADPALTGIDVPGYELMELLGRGGMGVVYKARHLALGRVVALKMIISGGLAGPDELARFQDEAAAIARLQHPNIVQIFEVGQAHGRPYFSLELVGGGSLARRLRGTPCPSDQAARLMEKLARAVDYAHGKGIVHRDLKPANILLAGCGERSSSSTPGTQDVAPSTDAVGQTLDLDVEPKLTDFGLARVMDNPEGRTETGAFLGTPSYSAPEQAAGRAVGPHTDVYALGAILYELLTGRPPFRGTSTLQTLQMVCEQEPVSPRMLNPAIDVDVETICLKCLRKAAGDRYPTAEALADDLHRHQAGEPILARPIGRWQRLIKWARRQPAFAAALALSAVLVPVLIVAVVSLIYQGRLADSNRELESVNDELKKAKALLEQQKLTEEKLRLLAEKQERQKQHFLYSQDMNEGGRIWLESRPGRLATLLERNLPQRTGGIDLRGFEWHYLNRLAHSELKRFTLDMPIRCALFSRSPDIVAFAGDNKIVFINLKDEKKFFKLDGHRSAVRTLAISPASNFVASGAQEGVVKLWEVSVPVRVVDLAAEGDVVESVCFSPNGTYVAAVSWANDNLGKKDRAPYSWLQIWHTGTRKEVCMRELNSPCLAQAIACRPDGKLLALGDWAGRIEFAELPSGKVLGAFQGHQPGRANVRMLAFNPAGKLLASAGADHTVKIWDVAKVPAEPAKLLHTLTGHTQDVNSVSFAEDGRRIATSSGDGTVRVWDAVEGKILRLFKGHGADVFSVSFASKGNRLLSGSFDKTARIWDSAVEQEGLVIKGYTHELRGVAFTPDSNSFVAVGLSQDNLWLRNARTGTVQRTYANVLRGFHGVAIAPDGKRFLTAGVDGVARLWAIDSPNQILALPAQASAITGVAFLDNGRAATSDRDGNARIWDLSKGQLLQTLEMPAAEKAAGGKHAAILSLACSRDGRYIAAGSADVAVRIWDAGSGKLLHTCTQHRDQVSAVAFSPDGRHLASAGYDGRALLWDVATGQKVLDIDGHETPIRSLAYTPDGKRIATGGSGSIRLWDTETGQETLMIRGHDKWIDGLAFSPDNRRLASVGIDQTVHIWDASEPAKNNFSPDVPK